MLRGRARTIIYIKRWVSRTLQIYPTEAAPTQQWHQASVQCFLNGEKLLQKLPGSFPPSSVSPGPVWPPGTPSSVSRARDSPGNSRRRRQSPAGGDLPGPTPTAPAAAHPPRPCAPLAPRTHRRSGWPGKALAPGYRHVGESGRRAGGRGPTSERRQHRLQLHLASFRLLTRTAPGSGPSLAPQLPRGRCPRARERRGAACLAAISARCLGWAHASH